MQANRAGPDHFVASELGLHCLHYTPKWISGLKRVKVDKLTFMGNSYTIFRFAVVPKWGQLLKERQ